VKKKPRILLVSAVIKISERFGGYSFLLRLNHGLSGESTKLNTGAIIPITDMYNLIFNIVLFIRHLSDLIYKFRD